METLPFVLAYDFEPLFMKHNTCLLPDVWSTESGKGGYITPRVPYARTELPCG